ncbi:MAG: thioredoxin family protein [Bacteroidales bacterium]|nr:thioredoxin family protein [Bacteroidales bacterium]HPD96060.1 thioredoxin family protein [Tenuifilaceae bacterium]HRX31278.1 thioredoxin family protein [Tenuifilaceae bacterium]
MKRTILLVILAIFSLEPMAQVNIYNPNANAKEDIQKAISDAKESNKNVLIQIGGNWCPWCVRLHKLFESNDTIKSIINDNYVWILVNYSKENKNLDIMKALSNPQRFGFPVLVILDYNGTRIHTQDTGLLESGKGYDNKKIIGFLKNWTVKVINEN